MATRHSDPAQKEDLFLMETYTVSQLVKDMRFEGRQQRKPLS